MDYLNRINFRYASLVILFGKTLMILLALDLSRKASFAKTINC
ncbi:hypothetical protein C8N25_10271 [Algoriphagus antarcticus]|uniref:Uncharacterized protein n=1 Tax=Algoriphagus antarcticus TaxID=238540 RepID=A0A3E0E390_9BACT|nr:hypothetical protein C8N25_10271 [Algoriphagus antarcticus]